MVKNLSKDDFGCLSQWFDNNVLGLAKQKGLYPYDYMRDFGSLRKSYLAKRSFVVHKLI